MNKPQTGPLWLEETDHKEQFCINGEPDAEHHEITYFRVSGYFGTYGPHVFLAAPQMLALLEELVYIEGPQPGNSEWAEKVGSLIAMAKGETNA